MNDHAVMLCHCDETTTFDALFRAERPLTARVWHSLMTRANRMWEDCSIGLGGLEALKIYPSMPGLLLLVARKQGITLTQVPVTKMEYTE